jgi:uncharacterized protein YcbK (DUF882 family)
MARSRSRRAALDQITPHFRLAEFQCPDGTPVPSSAHRSLGRLCEVYLEPLRAEFGRATVLSGFRTRSYNARVGGSPTSIHLYALNPRQVAADVRFEQGEPEEWAAAAERLKTPGVGRYDDSRYVHVDIRRGPAARWSGLLNDPPPPRAAPRRAVLDRITPHFRVAEFDCRDGTPVPVAAHDALRRLCEMYLEKLRGRFGAARVLSGFRHRAYNDRIGGARKSMHCYEEHPNEVAADLQFARGTPAEWASFAERLGVPGVGRYDDSRFVHVDNRKTGPARWSGFQG